MPQSARKSLPAQLPSQVLGHADEKARFFVAWWLRMHQDRAPLVAVSLKFVEWAAAGAVAQRFVWEVCRWPQGDSSEWTFVCWMLDGEGMWMRSFPSKRAAMAYFAQAPAVVMVRPQSADGRLTESEPLRRAS